MNRVKPIIFLDFDGVTALTGALDARLVRRVQRLALATDAHVVLTTSWRESHAHPFEELRGQLHAHGLHRSRVISQTPVLHGQTRGVEIATWLTNYRRPVRVAVIDDQDVGRFDMAPMRDHLVQTDPARGVTWQTYDKAQRLLTGGPIWTTEKWKENAVLI